MGKWTFNDCVDDLWIYGEYDTKEEAEKAAISWAKETEITKMYIGQYKPVPLPNYVSSEEILNGLNYQYEDECGVDYDRESLYADLSDEGIKWFEREISKLVDILHKREKIKSNWNTIENIYCIGVGGDE